MDSLEQQAGRTFVGRERELEIALQALEDSLAGRGRLLLLAGDAGIGKSRFADELAAEARRRGARVLWGRCWEAGGAPAYWPWVQSIRTHLRDRGPDELRAEMGAGAADIVQMLPELRELFDDLPQPAVETEGARFRLFDSTARLLESMAAERPLMLVLDDLHAADPPSLLMLRFIAGELAASPLLVVGAYRDTELEPDHPLSAGLAELLRERSTRLLALRGLGAPEVARYIELATGVEPTATLARTIHEQTEGNPLFFGELIRLMASEGGLTTAGAIRRLAIPPSVRDVIGRRLRRLSDESVEVLGMASVLGREFALDALARLAGRNEAELLPVLDEAVAARVVTDVPDSAGRMRFSHALIRETLYSELPPGQRPALHRRCREALESLYAQDLEPHLAELAHHSFEAIPVGDLRTAVDYGRRAAARAVALLAFEEAARLYELALQTLEREGTEDEGARCDLLLGLGDAQARAGDVPSAQASFLRAAEIARRITCPENLASAALGYGGRFVWEAGRGDPHLVPLLEEGLRVLGERDLPLRARLLARLAGGPLRDEPDRSRRAVLSEEAVELARRIGDPGTLAYVLDGRYAAIWWPDDLEQRLAVATELVEVAQRAGDKEREFQGRHYRCLALLELGDMSGVHAELEGQARLADELRQRAQLWYVASVRATLATFEGRFAAADELVTEAFGLGRRAQGPMARAYFTIHTYLLRREQGRLDEIEAAVREAAAAFPTYHVLRCVLAHLNAELGRTARARQALEEVLRGDPAELGLDDEWVFSACLLADVAGHVGDSGRAASLYEALLPYAHRNAGSNPDGCIGSVSRPLGVLAAALGNFDAAETYFRDARDLNARTGARPWVGQTQIDHARMLVARDAAGDRERAAELLDAALVTAREIGAAALEGKASDLLGGLRAAPADDGARAAACRFTREGDYWTASYRGEDVRLRDSKGVRYLAELVANPGREVSALSLAGTPPGEPATAARAPAALAEEGLGGSGLEDAGAALDAEAMDAYRRRVDDLRAELEEAERFNDPERAAAARAEIDFVTSELTAAVGRGGRARRLPGPRERARQSVTKAIRSAIDRIAEHSPALGEHLAVSVRTGAACIYDPDGRVHTP
jgi:tetratricopeptide (TPR) repeat protein